jgi:hypothetical protein
MTNQNNPKVATGAASNLKKDPDDWVSGDEPMTGAQASYLKTLSEEAGGPNAFSDKLSKAEASTRTSSSLRRTASRTCYVPIG